MMNSETRLAAATELLRKLECDSVAHSRRSLFDHLMGTHDLLRSWGADESVCLAGLFHSVYGTESFRNTVAELPDRKVIAATIGQEAEALAWLFGIKSNQSFWDQVRVLSATNASAFTLINRLTGDSVPCTRNELLHVVNMVLANAFDQADHIPEHFTERKSAVLWQLLRFALPEATVAFNKRFGERKPSGAAVAQSQAATVPGNG